MTYAVCINCGAKKKRPIDRCSTCGFKPRSDEDKAKSLILSTAYEVNGEYRGKTVEEFKKIAADIRAGRHYKFNENEVSAVIAYAHQVMAIPASRLIIDGVKWIALPVIILAAVYLLLFTKS
jgi:predicted ATP-dependent serine protease